MKQDPIDLIRLTDGISSVTVRVTDCEAISDTQISVLVGEFVVNTKFIKGALKTWIFPEDLTAWEETLDALARGENASWRKDKRATELTLDVNAPELSEGMVQVSVADWLGSRATAQVVLEPADGWIEDHRARLDRIRGAWPQ
ncbi:DUF5959 family protein [Streptomyces niveus]|uniref:DUF5959 family protein n=1 Tax=Streptomyces niveus TaxID=193462 RepID=UPI0003C61C2F|nr:DUF5959 family protein [Streptomyces niveus]EST18086.1 hypothetical protein M877_39365 [Streptomyces niveus NCIMB 11891]